MALENNLGVQAERLNPQIRTSRCRGRAAPTRRSCSRTSSLEQHGAADRLPVRPVATSRPTGEPHANGGRQQNPWVGGNYRSSFDRLARTTDAPTSRVQPAARIRPDACLRAAAAARLQDRQLPPEHADQRRTTRRSPTSSCASGSRRRRAGAERLLQADWRDLRPRGRAAVARLAQQSLRNNQRRVEVGTMAPIDIIEAEAEVARATRKRSSSQGRDRGGAGQPAHADPEPVAAGLLGPRIEPTEQPSLTPQPIDVDAAIKNALANRTDLRQLASSSTTSTSTSEVQPEPEAARRRLTADYGTDRRRRHAVRFSTDRGCRRRSSARRSAASATRCATSSATTSGPGAWRST